MFYFCAVSARQTACSTSALGTLILTILVRKMVGSFVGVLDNDKTQAAPLPRPAAPTSHLRLTMHNHNHAARSCHDAHHRLVSQAFVRKVAAAAGPLPSDMLLSDADALIASGDLPAASSALQVFVEHLITQRKTRSNLCAPGANAGAARYGTQLASQ